MYLFIQKLVESYFYPNRVRPETIISGLPLDGLRVYRGKHFKGDYTVLLQKAAAGSKAENSAQYHIRKYRRSGPLSTELILGNTRHLKREFSENGKAVTVREYWDGWRPWVYHYEDGNRLSFIERTVVPLRRYSELDRRLKQHKTIRINFSWDTCGRLIAISQNAVPELGVQPYDAPQQLRLEYQLEGQSILYFFGDKDKAFAGAWVFDFPGRAACIQHLTERYENCRISKMLTRVRIESIASSKKDYEKRGAAYLITTNQPGVIKMTHRQLADFWAASGAPAALQK